MCVMCCVCVLTEFSDGCSLVVDLVEAGRHSNWRLTMDDGKLGTLRLQRKGQDGLFMRACKTNISPFQLQYTVIEIMSEDRGEVYRIKSTFHFNGVHWYLGLSHVKYLETVAELLREISNTKMKRSNTD